ncbi:MAG: hypothetical protein H8D46_03900, partial [FCB group bacterium]|nr:hypothetical protein [FCB group bacterium]
AVRTEITKKNMMDRGIYEGSSDYFLLRIDRPDSKPVRMQEVLEGTGRMAGVGPLKVLAYFGDAMGDFPDEGQNHAWGLQNFILPNPMYGKW